MTDAQPDEELTTPSEQTMPVPPPLPPPLSPYGLPYAPGYGAPYFGTPMGPMAPPVPSAKGSTKRGCWIAAAIVGGLVLLLVAFLAGLALGTTGGSVDSGFHGVNPDDPSTIVKSASKIDVGTCVNTSASSATSVSCKRTHDAEVSGTLSLPPEMLKEFPRFDSLDVALPLCQAFFDDFVGVSYDNSEYEVGAIVPNEKELAAGHTTVNCLVYSWDGPVDYVLRNSES